MVSFLPYRLEFSERAVDDLRRRLGATRWPSIAWNTGWSTGTHDGTLRELARYWAKDFDWPAQQAALNQRSHIRGPIEGDEVHALVEAGPAGRLPILLIHGWPSSFVEHLDSTRQLAGEGFDAVAVSLPGFGLSEEPRSPGVTPVRIAERLHQFMVALGYARYGVHGGDWGAIVGTHLARLHPEAVSGLHITFARVPRVEDPESLSAAEREWLAFRADFEREETGYSRLQRTRPQTLGYALNDSPVGLLSWIVEKFWAWTDHGDDLWERLDRDRLLTNVTLYWLTGTALSSARIYYEAEHAPRPPEEPEPIEVPVGYARYPREPWAPPREMVERVHRLAYYAEPEAGGHFPALEVPDVFVRDLATFFRALPG